MQDIEQLTITLNGQMLKSVQAIDIRIRLTGTTVWLQGVMLGDGEPKWLLQLWKSGEPIQVTVQTHELTLNAKMRTFGEQTAKQNVGKPPIWTAEIVEIDEGGRQDKH